MDDLDSKLAAARAASPLIPANPNGQPTAAPSVANSSASTNF